MWQRLFVVALVATALLGATEGASPGAGSYQQLDSIPGLSYNILEGDPDAPRRGGFDAGLRIDRRMVDLEPSDKWPSFDRACETTADVIYDERTFQKKFWRNVVISNDMPQEVVKARFSLSKSFLQARKQIYEEYKITWARQILCKIITLRINPQLRVHRASQGFQEAVCRLPITFDKGPLVKFLDDWGVSFVEEAAFGCRRVIWKTASMASVFEKLQREIDLNPNDSGELGNAFRSIHGNVEMDMVKLMTMIPFYKALGEMDATEVIGAEQRPQLVYLKVRSLLWLVNPESFGSKNPSACTKDQLSRLTLKRFLLAKALTVYYRARGITQCCAEVSDGKARFPLHWPTGTYGLLQPKSEELGTVDGDCPTELGAKGTYTWHTNRNTYRNNQTPLSHFFGYVQNEKIKLGFCMKNAAGISHPTDMGWPRGQYCIYKSGFFCPSGFSYGAIYWDDENKYNENTASGSLPSGNYYQDTSQEFCCRNDGNRSHAIFLPRTKPFYLVQATEYGCQSVAGMNVRQEWIRWDTEDTNNKNRKYGFVPYVDDSGGDLRLFFCYYFA